MFKLYKNADEANHILEIFKPLFIYSNYQENIYDCFNNYVMKKYTAETPDEWNVIVNFYVQRQGKELRKSFNPSLQFEKDKKSKMTHFNNDAVAERFKKSKDIAEFIQNLYEPDFNRVISIVEMFIDQGIQSGMINSANIKKYKKAVIDHMHINHYHGLITVGSYNISTITFNNLLQEAQGKKRNHFKKSFISITFEYLINSNNEVDLYFKIKLPYSSNSKLAYIIPIKGGDEISLVFDDDRLKSTPIDKIITLPITKEALIPHFQEEFKQKIKDSIAKTLKIKKKELDNMTSNELKDYFVIVEMLKI